MCIAQTHYCAVPLGFGVDGNIGCEVTHATIGIDIRLLTMQVSLLGVKVR
jgi:hypothetical protein